MDYNPVGWFELPVTDMDRAKKFYETVLGISMTRQGGPEGYEMLWFPWHDKAPGAPGALMKGMGYEPTDKGVIIYFSSEDLDGALSRVEGAGGKITLPKKAIGEYGFIAWAKDSEGNMIGLHSIK